MVKKKSALIPAGLVYKIDCSCCKIVYIGSSDKMLADRWYEHTHKPMKHQQKLHRHMFKVGYSNMKITEIECHHNVKQSDLLEREQHYINKYGLDNLFNMRNAILAEGKNECPHNKIKYQCNECSFKKCHTCKNGKRYSKASYKNHIKTKKHIKVKSIKDDKQHNKTPA